MTLTASEFWLLDCAVTMPIDLPVLVNPRIEEALNCRTHGLSRQALVELLVSLFERGLITATHDSRPVALDLNQIELGLAGRGPRFEPTTHYLLTPLGGAVWERATRPDWTRYDDVSDFKEERVVEAATVELAREVFAEGWDASTPAPRWTEERLTPWEATYWKQLPAGFRLRGPPVVEDWRVRVPERVWYTPPAFEPG